MNIFADSSALAKRYISDETSDEFDKVLERATGLAVSALCLPEIVSALCRRRRERAITPAQYALARNALESDLADVAIIQTIDEVLIGAIHLLERYPLRASDAIQVSSAVVWGADIFVSADNRQCTAAKRAKLTVVRL